MLIECSPCPRPWAKHFIRIGLLIFHICHLRQIFLSQFHRWGDLSIETLNPLLPSGRSMDLNAGIWLQSSEPQWCISSHLLTWHHLPWSIESGSLLLGLSPVSAVVRFRLLHSILVINNCPSLDYLHADLKCDRSSFVLLFCFVFMVVMSLRFTRSPNPIFWFSLCWTLNPFLPCL